MSQERRRGCPTAFPQQTQLRPARWGRLRGGLCLRGRLRHPHSEVNDLTFPTQPSECG